MEPEILREGFDAILTKFLSENAISILFSLYILGGLADALEGVEGTNYVAVGVREVGKVIGIIVKIIEGALEAIKPKRNGTKKPEVKP